LAGKRRPSRELGRLVLAEETGPVHRRLVIQQRFELGGDHWILRSLVREPGDARALR